MASEFSVETSLVNYQPEKLDTKEFRNGMELMCHSHMDYGYTRE